MITPEFDKAEAAAKHEANTRKTNQALWVDDNKLYHAEELTDMLQQQLEDQDRVYYVFEPDPLFVGVLATGIIYADRTQEQDGDYKRLAFLSFATLILVVEPDCPPELEERIRQDAAELQAKQGQVYQTTSSGQTVILGSANMTTRQIEEAYLAYAVQQNQATVYYTTTNREVIIVKSRT